MKCRIAKGSNLNRTEKDTAIWIWGSKCRRKVGLLVVSREVRQIDCGGRNAVGSQEGIGRGVERCRCLEYGKLKIEIEMPYGSVTASERWSEGTAN